jgi:uncharacterized membrane protein (UPF0127 family)
LRVKTTILAAALMLGACSSGPIEAGAREPAAQGQAAAVHPASGLPVIDLAVHSGKTRHAFRVEVAASPEEQAKGLMFRTEMGADEGMLFPHDPPRRASFWMKNTVIPLDIIYVGTDGRILNIVDAKPYDLTPLPSAGVASAVLELNGGRAAQLGIKAGDKVSWTLPKPGQ